jgi:cysteine desulfurase
MFCYLDNSATTMPSAPAVEAMLVSMREGFFNPSALYKPAMLAEKAMDQCRAAIAARLGADAGGVIFSSGGTEADNLAILGGAALMRGTGRILYSAGEHPAVKAACESLSKSFCVMKLPYDSRGIVDAKASRELITPDTRMICLMQVNNETGAVQSVAEIARLRDAQAPDALLHVDGVQGFPALAPDIKKTGIDSYALSAHKFHGPKGIGALVLGNRMRVTPRMLGGGQEKGMRSGTPNTPGIQGMLAAIASYPFSNDVRRLKLLLLQLIRAEIKDLRVNGPDPAGLDSSPHILNLSLMGTRSETMLHALEAEAVYVGTGSACSSGKNKISAVLQAMGTPPGQAQCALRFSLSPYNTQAEVEFAADAVIRNYRVLRKYGRR